MMLQTFNYFVQVAIYKKVVMLLGQIIFTKCIGNRNV